MHSPISFPSVAIADAFWAPKLRVNRESTIPIEYQQSKDTGRIDSLRLGWRPGDPNPPHIFWDSDVAKWIEAASYSFATHPDPDLDVLLDEVIALIASAQQPDGYLNVHFTVVEPEKRWTNLRDWHELYCAGHLIEAAVAHFQATGKRTLLDVLRRYADAIGMVFGPGEGQKPGYCGHEEIELALVKLGRVTGEPKYLDLARYFVNQRGAQPHYYDQEAIQRGEDPARFWGARGLLPEKRYSYMQAHLPVREQREVTGHAVRAMYLYSAMADLAQDDPTLRPALDALWQDVCLRKMYLTGGIGPSRHNEGFTHPYDLPNETAYAETCAAIGLVFWNHRMLQLECDGRYADVMERALYNGVLSGVSLDGTKFFYENPLASIGTHHRQEWFDCACCPPNLARLLASLGQYVYSVSQERGAADGELTGAAEFVQRDQLAVHLYIQGSAQASIGGRPVIVHQETRYPWDGVVQLTFEMDSPLDFMLKLRLPAWCRRYQLQINDQPASPSLLHGYLCLERAWRAGDTVTFEMDMPIERVYAHPDVRQDAGQVALQRGPLVYCLEDADNDPDQVPLHQVFLPRDATWTARFEAEKLGGVVILEGSALVSGGWPVDALTSQAPLYRASPPVLKPCRLTAIPYFAWDNRQPGAMRVWLPERGEQSIADQTIAV